MIDRLSRHQKVMLQEFISMDLKWLKHREPVASLFSTRVYYPQFISGGIISSTVGETKFPECNIPCVKLSLEFLCHCILNPLLEDTESRSSRKESVQILSECHKLYCEQRLPQSQAFLNTQGEQSPTLPLTKKC